MVDGINFNNINKLNNINNKKIIEQVNTQTKKAGIFGDGFKNNTQHNGIERNVIPQHLADKFANVQTAKYNKNIPQLVIKDSDYIPDKEVKEKAFCEV